MGTFLNRSMPFDQLRKVAADKSAEAVVGQSQPAGNGLQILRRRFVEADRLAVPLHAAPRNEAAVPGAHHPLPGVKIRLMLFQILPETLRVQAELRGDLRRGAVWFLAQPRDSRSVFRSRRFPVMFGRRKTRAFPVFRTPPGEGILPAPRTQVARQRFLAQPQFPGNLPDRHSRIPVEPHGFLIAFLAYGHRFVAAARTGDVPFPFGRLAALAQVTALLDQILVIEKYVMTKTSHGNSAPLGDLREGQLTRAEQLHGPGILLAAPRTDTPLLVVGKTPTATLRLPAFQNVRIVGAELIGQTRAVQPEQPCYLRDVVFEVVHAVARRDRIPVFGAGRRGLAPAPPQPHVRGVRDGQRRDAVAGEQQTPMILIQVTAKTDLRHAALLTNADGGHAARSIQRQSLPVTGDCFRSRRPLPATLCLR